MQTKHACWACMLNVRAKYHVCGTLCMLCWADIPTTLDGLSRVPKSHVTFGTLLGIFNRLAWDSAADRPRAASHRPTGARRISNLGSGGACRPSASACPVGMWLVGREQLAAESPGQPSSSHWRQSSKAARHSVGPTDLKASGTPNGSGSPFRLRNDFLVGVPPRCHEIVLKAEGSATAVRCDAAFEIRPAD